MAPKKGQPEPKKNRWGPGRWLGFSDDGIACCPAAYTPSRCCLLQPEVDKTFGLKNKGKSAKVQK